MRKEVHQKPFITSVIIGVKTPEHIDRLDAVSALPSEYPAWMVTRQHRDRSPATEEKATMKKTA